MGEPELDVVGRDMDRGCRYFCIWYGAGILGRAMGTASGPDDVQVEKKHESSRNVRMAEIIDDNLCHPHVSGACAGAKRKLSTDQEAEKHTGALTGRSGYPSSTVFTRLLKAKKAGGDTPDPDQVSGGATTGWECTAPLTGAKPLDAQTNRDTPARVWREPGAGG